LKFTLEKTDTHTRARAGSLTTAHGTILTPIFMPVGTQGTVKALAPSDLNEVGAQIILGNSYHLYLRPGPAVIEQAGGIQKFSAWHKPVLTDSGGYQIFSLAELNKVTPAGLKFQSHLDGSYHFFSPESVIDLQRSLGADIMMVLDECVAYPCSHETAATSTELTIDWAQRSLQTYQQLPPRLGYEQALFGIVQGSTYPDLRRQCASALIELDFDGYAIGGLSVGEPKTELYEMTSLCTEILPGAKPRYLMGVGKPEDLVIAIGLGIDMFDCVIPTRNGRNGTVFTWEGHLIIKNAQYREDFRAIDANCQCYCCRNFTRAYLRHLFQAHEILALRLASIHNLHFYLQLVQTARQAILADQYAAWQHKFLTTYQFQSE
jgi:queuine tRNA-ribosyltransferase